MKESLTSSTEPKHPQSENEVFVDAVLSAGNLLATHMGSNIELLEREKLAFLCLSKLTVVRILEQKEGFWKNSEMRLNVAWDKAVEHGDNVSQDLIIAIFDQLGSVPDASESTENLVNPAGCEYFVLGPEERLVLSTLSNEVWEPILGPDGLFARPSFSLSDSDVANHVTPLVLGRLLELKLKDREGTGTYYTPPEIVRQMVRRSIERSLSHHCGEELPPLIRSWIWGGAMSSGLLSNDLFPLVQSHLSAMKVLDPAVGSGAYLVCVADELARLRLRLDSEQSLPQGDDTASEVLHHIIQSSTYGVDLNEEAVMLTRVRLWLWLMHHHRQFIPMPPLNLNIISGDSVAGKDVGFERLAWAPQHPLAAVDTLLEFQEQYLLCSPQERSDVERSFDETFRNIKQQINDPDLDSGVVYQLQFPAVFRCENPGFSIVLANPPYVRAESLAEEYKIRLKRLLNSEGYEPVSSTSDLFCAFFVKSFRLLQTGGVQAFLCSNSWMDVDYGIDLKHLLLKHTVVELLDVSKERTFRDAAVNTIISIVQKTDVLPDNKTLIVRMADHTSYLESRENAIERLQSSILPNEKWTLYVQGKPSFWLYDELPELESFSTYGTITRGFTSGTNEFFFIKEGVETGIEEAFLRPLIKSPREIKGLIVTPEMLSMHVFICSDSKAELETKAPGALAYIEQGEQTAIEIKKGNNKGTWLQGYHQLATTSSRPLWYALPELKPSDILLRQFFDKVFDFPTNPSNFLTDHTFYYISVHRPEFVHKDLSFNQHTLSVAERSARLAAFLNSTIGWLLIESVGRKNMGEGVLTCYGPEFKRIKIPSLEKLAEIVEPFKTLAQRPVKSVFEELGVNQAEPATFSKARSSTQADRRALDDAVFDVLGFDENQREQWYIDFLEAIAERLSKSKNIL